MKIPVIDVSHCRITAAVTSGPFLAAMIGIVAVAAMVVEQRDLATQPSEDLFAAVARGAPDSPPQEADAIARLGKPVQVVLASSSVKLSDMFDRIGYRLDGVKQNGTVPRLFLGSLPDDLRHIPHPSKRKVMFIKSALPLILHVNEQVEQQRERLLAIQDSLERGEALTAEDESWLAWLAEYYGADEADCDKLLRRVDIVPVSLALAQAAEESGWGTSRFAREGNALFGQRAYSKKRKGIVPKDRGDGATYRVRAFDHLLDGVKAYIHNLNSHAAYQDFRENRAKMREDSVQPDGYALAAALKRYSERGEAYVRTIRKIIRANGLHVFDTVRLGKQVSLSELGSGA